MVINGMKKVPNHKINLGSNTLGLEQYTATVQFDFFAGDPKDAYRLMFDNLISLYEKVEKVQEEEENKHPCLKAILQIQDKNGNIVAQQEGRGIKFKED